MSSQFVDDEGVAWTIHLGLPDSYPDIGEHLLRHALPWPPRA